MKIAVVGSGISGLSSSYYLSKKHKVDLFEKQDRFGGHSYTLDVEYNDKEKVSVDIGFMVFNKITYPNLINFFKENEIEIEKSDMSFSISSQPAYGQASITGNSITYTPQADFSGNDFINVLASSNSGSLTITIQLDIFNNPYKDYKLINVQKKSISNYTLFFFISIAS